MDKPSKTPGLFQRLRARRAASVEDAADMGTAFGMEMSLGGNTPMPSVAAASRAPRWLRRFAARGRSAL